MTEVQFLPPPSDAHKDFLDYLEAIKEELGLRTGDFGIPKELLEGGPTSGMSQGRLRLFP